MMALVFRHESLYGHATYTGNGPIHVAYDNRIDISLSQSGMIPFTYPCKHGGNNRQRPSPRGLQWCSSGQ